jgi:putative flippase GtrA
LSAATELLAALAVGACALCVDASTLYLLAGIAHLHYLVAASFGFVAGTLLAWALSVRFVFRYRRCPSARQELAMFAAIGGLGLAINAAVIAIVVEVLGQHYLVGKACAAVVTFGFNYGLRRALLFSPALVAPAGQAAHATPGIPDK